MERIWLCTLFVFRRVDSFKLPCPCCWWQNLFSHSSNQILTLGSTCYWRQKTFFQNFCDKFTYFHAIDDETSFNTGQSNSYSWKRVLVMTKHVFTLDQSNSHISNSKIFITLSLSLSQAHSWKHVLLSTGNIFLEFMWRVHIFLIIVESQRST